MSGSTQGRSLKPAVADGLAAISTGEPVAGALVAQLLHDLDYVPVSRQGKARTWKHPACPAVLTYREQPTGEIDWSDEIKKVERHVRKVLEILERQDV